MKKLPTVVATVIFFLILTSPCRAANFSIQPQSESFNVGDTVSVKLFIDTQGQKIVSADAVFNYDNNLLQLVKVEPGDFFSNIFPKDKSDVGRLRIGAINALDPNDPANSGPGAIANGSGLMATLIFKAAASGDASLAFSCTTDPSVVCCANDEIRNGICEANRLCNNSSILNVETAGIVNYIICPALVDGQYTLVGGEDNGDKIPSPTFPLETPVPGTPACDLCGYCGGDYPPNYDACQACLSQPSKAWTPIGCVPTNAGGFVQAILSFLLPLAGGLAFLGIIYGGFLLLASKGEPLRISHGKSILIGSIGALLLIVFSVFLLKLVGFEILGIPGFG